MPNIREFPIDNGITYGVKPDHRDNTHVKSQWTITVDEEVLCFRLTCERTWFLDDRGWGLHLTDGKAQYLGVGLDRNQRLFVARFEGDLPKQYWHGYPADHVRRADDIPAEAVAGEWIAEGYLPPSKVRKLLKGQRCKL